VRRIVALAVLALAAGAPDAGAQRQDVSVASGFTAPTSMALAPDGRIFVTEQGGTLRVVKDGELLDDEFLAVDVTATNERGLLGVTFDPQFASNRFVYVYYTRASPQVNRLSRFTASASNPDIAEPGSEEVILDDIVPATSGYHNGGAIHFGTDGRLYVAVGEGHTGSNAQSLSTLAGKLLRIERDGEIPADNPFYGSATGNNRAIWALGLRNPFTFDIQRTTGRIFINDVGESAFEEIDEAWSGPNSGSNAGFNFGWPDTEGPTTDPTFRTPFHAYPLDGAECAITGGAFYEPLAANFPAQYAGDYFFADFCAGWIKSIDLATKQVSTFIDADSARRPVDIKVAADGSLYYLRRAGSAPAEVRRVRYPTVAPPVDPADPTPTPSPPAAVPTAPPSTGTPPPPSPLTRLRIRAPARMSWAGARRRGIPVRVRGVAGARVRIVVRSGRRRLATRSVRVGATGERLIRVRVRRGASDRRRRVRLELTAVLRGGRRLSAAHRIVLFPRR